MQHPACEWLNSNNWPSGIPVGLGDREAVSDVCVELDGDLEGLGPRRPVARHPLAPSAAAARGRVIRLLPLRLDLDGHAAVVLVDSLSGTPKGAKIAQNLCTFRFDEAL